ncbi:MAG: beta-carotene 15,15'-monooxygenase [Bacteroidetes bacterium]|nr:beta-carotene 15,15'-monooxygenase [Bacteroidota bacterium]
MGNNLAIFKNWVPEWLIKIILFSLLLPSTVLFFLPLSNINAAAGYYGSEPADIQFSVAVFYAGYAGFYALERRFFDFLAAKEYFVLFTFLNIATTLICYLTNDIYIFFPIRFIQGMLFSSTVNLSLAVIFSRLHSERAREISFSVFFGMLLCAVPFNNFVTADLIDTFNFNTVYKIAIFSYLPGLIALMIMLNNFRLNIRFPLYKLDWQSFLFYSIILILIGYIMIFGQEYYWLEDERIRYSTISIFILTLVYFVRQKSMRRFYVNLSVLKSRNFNVGMLLLFIMYICRFGLGIMNNFFSNVLKFDPMHVSYINLFNLSGIVLGVIISCSIVLQRKPIRYVWIPGFLILFIFYISMFYLFDIYANEFNYFLPLFLHGLGVGMIMVPTIIFSISSVAVKLGPSASALGLVVRYLGFCVSIAIMNYFELYEKSRHYNAFQDKLTVIDPAVKHNLITNSIHLSNKGFVALKPAKASGKLLINSLNMQNHLRFAMDYFEIMAWLLLFTLLLVAMFPYLNRTAMYLKSKVLSPA